MAHSLGDGNPENASSISGTLHRGWINLKTVIAGRDQRAILEECERGEDIALAVYKEALASELPHPIREVIEKQQTAILATHDQVKILRDVK